MNINLSKAKRRAPFLPSFRSLTWRAWCFRNEVSSPDVICFEPKGRGRFQGFKKRFKLSRLLSFFAKESSISLTLTVPFIVACGEGLCVDCSQSPFFPIRSSVSNATILVSKLSLAWGLVPPCSVHSKLILRPAMAGARFYGKSRGLCVTVKSPFFSLSSFSCPSVFLWV